MARLEDIERRLLNWARWKHGAGSGGLGYGSTWNMEPSGSKYREAVIPTVDCEASETDMAIQSLDERLQMTIRQVYLTGASATIDAEKLGCSAAAVKARIWDAHRRISNWLHDRKTAADNERRRVEALMRTSKGAR